MALEPGYMVSKQVRLVRKLKGGGMGSVWVADHLALHTQVAVKFISGDHVANPELSARFKREATSAARIKSPHVVQVHDHGVTEEGLPFIVMELLEGEDLSTRLKQQGVLSVDDVASIVQQTCRVLSRAHKIGVVHRDIKPANLFLVEADGAIFVKLLDFGVAKMGNEASDLTNTGVMVGTLCYMSPEQLLDARNVDHRADLWSLAVVAYRSLTGQLPFKDENGLGALVLAVDRGVFAQASSLMPDIPESIDPWFAKAFRRQVDSRFSSAREMSDALLLALGRKVPSDEPSTRDRATIPDRPEPPTPLSHTKIGVAPPPNPASRKSAPTLTANPVRPAITEDSGTVGGISARPVRKRASLLAWSMIGVLTIVVVVIGGEIALQRYRAGSSSASASPTSPQQPTPPQTSPQQEAQEATPTGSPLDASASSASVVATSSSAELAAGPATTLSVEASASTPPTASAAGGAKRHVVPGGVPPKNEKDYGF